MEHDKNFIAIDSELLNTANLHFYNSLVERHWPDVFCDHGYIAHRWYKWKKYCYIIKGVKKHEGVCHKRMDCEKCEPFENFLQSNFRSGAKFAEIISELEKENLEYVVEIFAWESIADRIFISIFPVPSYHLIINPIRIHPTLEEINSQWEENKREIRLR